MVVQCMDKSDLIWLEVSHPATEWLTNSKMSNKILCFNTSNTKILRYQGAQVRAQGGGSRTRMQVNCICCIRVHFKLNRKTV